MLFHPRQVHFSAFNFKRNAELIASMMRPLRRISASIVQTLQTEPAAQSRLCAMLKNYHKPKPNLRQLLGWKMPCRPSGKSYTTKTHQQGGGGELHQALDYLHGRGCQWSSRWASAVTLSNSASSSQHQQTGSNRLFSEPPTHYWQTQRSERWEMGVVFVETASVLLFLDIFQVNLVIKCTHFVV